MDRLDAMTVLLAAIDEGSLSAASRKLGVPLPTVSRKVSELEAHLRASLLTRTSRRLELTDAGRDYVEACRRILQDVEEAERAASGEYVAPKGSLVVTAPIVFGRLHVLPVVTSFLKIYPEIDVRLELCDRVVNLIEDHVDVATRIGRLPDSSLRAARVGEVRKVVCASPDYLAAQGRPERPEDLGRHQLVTFEQLSAPQSWRFRNGAKDIAIDVRSRLTVTTAEAAIDAARDGLGLTTVLSYQVAREIRDGALETVLEEYEPAPAPIHLVYAGHGRLPLKLRAFLDYSAPRVKASVQERAGLDPADAAS